MRILVAGDILPTEKNQKYFEKGETLLLFGSDILNLFNNSDIKVANLEGVFTDNGKPIEKSGPAIKISEKTINGIVPLNFNALSLANNHTMDFGESGLYRTMEILKENNISYFGAGKNLQEAKKPYIIESDGINIGFYSCAETEFNIAETSGGV